MASNKSFQTKSKKNEIFFDSKSVQMIRLNKCAHFVKEPPSRFAHFISILNSFNEHNIHSNYVLS